MHLQRIAFAAMTLCAAHAALAETAADVERLLRSKYPATRITTVRESPVKGVFEVVMGRNIAYTDAAGRYMIFGHVYDMAAQRDLTAEALDELARVDLSALPAGDAIKTVRGKGERTLYVFSDPDCPFCKRLEPELAKLDNVTIYTFLYPLETLHPDARRKAEAIWCAPDRVAAWQAFMKDGTVPESAKCDTPVARNIKLGGAIGISGTPTLIFADGKLAPGYMPADEIERRMAAATRNSAAQAAQSRAAQ